MLRRIQILSVLFAALALCLQAQPPVRRGLMTAAFQSKGDEKAKEAKPPTPTPEPVQVSGIVTNQDGRGLQHVEVTIAAAKGGEKKTPTNASGGYTFELLPGHYTLTAKSSGGKSKSLQVDVRSGKSNFPPLILDVQP